MIRSIVLEDVGREPDQQYWMNVEGWLLMGQNVLPNNGLILVPLLLWFALGFYACVLIQRRIARDELDE
jgi:hypothetical protein